MKEKLFISAASSAARDWISPTYIGVTKVLLRTRDVRVDLLVLVLGSAGSGQLEKCIWRARPEQVDDW